MLAITFREIKRAVYEQPLAALLLLVLGCIPVIGSIWAVGFVLEWAQDAYFGRNFRSIKEISLWYIFKNFLWLLGNYIVYGILLVALTMIVGLVVAGISIATPLSPGLSFGGFIALISTIFLSLIIIVFPPLMVVRTVIYGKTSEMLSIRSQLKSSFSNKKSFFSWLVITIIGAIIINSISGDFDTGLSASSVSSQILSVNPAVFESLGQGAASIYILLANLIKMLCTTIPLFACALHMRDVELSPAPQEISSAS